MGAGDAPYHRFMDLRRLGYFAVLAEELNFTRAARRLHIAQPALSQQIQALERQVGARLVLRGSKGCSLTPVGVVVAEEAGRLLRQAEAAEQRIQAAVRGRPAGCGSRTPVRRGAGWWTRWSASSVPGTGMSS